MSDVMTADRSSLDRATATDVLALLAAHRPGKPAR